MDILNKLNHSVSEPKVFALLVKSSFGQVLHLGVHFALEEAYAAAIKRIEMLPTHKPGTVVDIDLWNSIPARQIIAQLLDPMKIDELSQILTPKKDLSVVENKLKTNEFFDSEPKIAPPLDEYIQDMKESKNDLMKKLIEEGDIKQVEKVRGLIGSFSRQYVLKEIEKRTTKSNPKEKIKLEYHDI